MTTASTLSSSARRALRAAAHHLDPVVMMGQNGLTPAVLHEIDLALTAHALIKVRVQSDERETRDAYLAEICQKLGCESVQHLGKLFVLWRNAEGATDADKNAEQDAASVRASNDPAAKSARGPRSKLPSERAAERAAAPAGRAGGFARPSGAYAPARAASAPGERRRYGEAPPEAPRREGWAPKDRRGAARFGATEGGDDSRRRDGTSNYGAPRGRPPAAGGYNSGAPRGTGGPPTGGRGGYGSDNRGGATGGGQGGYQGSGERRSSYGQGQNDAAPRARWGDRREPSQGGGYGGDNSAAGGGAGGYGGGGSGSGSDRGAPKQRASYGRNSDAAAGGRPPRTGGGGYAGGGTGGSAPAGGRGGWGSRDGVTGKPSGFSRGGAGGSGTGGGGGSAPPRARRRMG